MTKIETERFSVVVDSDLGVSLRVSPDDDGLDLVQVSTKDGASRGHFGDVRLVLEPDFAVALAEAMLEAAKAAEARRAAQLRGILSR